MSPRFKTRVRLQVLVDGNPLAQVDQDLALSFKAPAEEGQQTDSSDATPEEIHVAREDLRRRMVGVYQESLIAGAPALAEAMVSELLHRLRQADAAAHGQTVDARDATLYVE